MEISVVQNKKNSHHLDLLLKRSLESYLITSKQIKLEKNSEILLKKNYAPGVVDDYLVRIVAYICKPPAPKQLVFALMAEKIVFPTLGLDGLTFPDVAIFLALKLNGSFYLRYVRRKPITQSTSLLLGNNELTVLPELIKDDSIANLSSRRSKLKIHLNKTRSKMAISVDGKEFALIEFRSIDKTAVETFYERLRTIIRPQRGESFRTLKALKTGCDEITMKEVKVEWLSSSK